MTKRVLITGANGQLGHEMRNVLDGDDRFEAIFTDVAELDICDAEAVNRAVADNRVDYIVTEGDKINLLEVNTTPGMTATSFIPQQVRAAGLDIKDVMTDIIENKF